MLSWDQLYLYSNLTLLVEIALVGVGILLVTGANAHKFRSLSLGLVLCASFPARNLAKALVHLNIDSTQFLISFTFCWILFWILYYLLKRIPERFMCWIAPLAGLLFVGGALYEICAHVSIAILFDLGLAALGIFLYNMRRMQKRLYPTYADLLAETGTPLPENRKSLLFYLTQYFVPLYLAWRFLFTLPFAGHSVFTLIIAILLLFTECLSIGEFLINCTLLRNRHKFPLPKEENAQDFPDVDVLIATYNEDASLLYKTIYGCRRMKYPDPSKVHIYLCDDGHRPQIKELAERTHIHYLTREDRQGAKAGNLNNALNHTSSELVVTFDADMVPRSSFLMETIPYFIDAKKRNEILRSKGKPEMPLGFVQTPQAFYNQDLFQYHFYAGQSIPNEQDYFYREIQPARTMSNSVIYGGSNTILSRQALESAGGFYTKAITEDFATGLLIEGNGYVSLATSKPLTYGLSAEDFASLVSQRIRWGRGVINVLYQINIFFTRRYSNVQKASYWSSIQFWLYPFIRSIYMIAPFLSAVFSMVVVNASISESLYFWLPMMITQTLTVRKLSQGKRTSFWTIIYNTILAPFLFFPLLFELLGISMKTFKVTNKGIKNSRHARLRYIWIFVLIFVLNLTAFCFALRDLLIRQFAGMLITLFWTGYNTLITFAALLFVCDSRKGAPLWVDRSSLSAYLCNDSRFDPGVTVYLDEEQIGVVFVDHPHLTQGETVTLRLGDKDQMTSLQARFIQNNQHQGTLIAHFQITHFDDYDQFLELLHDRDASTPVISAHTSLSSTLLDILRKRREHHKEKPSSKDSLD